MVRSGLALGCLIVSLRARAFARGPVDHRGECRGEAEVACADELPGSGDAEDEEHNRERSQTADTGEITGRPVQLRGAGQLQSLPGEKNREHADVAAAYPLMHLQLAGGH